MLDIIPGVKILVKVNFQIIIKSLIKLSILKIFNSKIGDSGGGMYIYDSSISKYIPVGIVSYGRGCALAETPG